MLPRRRLLRTDIQLQLGQVSETVEVAASAVVIQTDNAKVSTQVQNKLVDELPLVVAGAMRSPFNLVAVAPEAKGSGPVVARRRSGAAWDATLDGHSVGTNRSSDAAEAALNTPSVESLTEFTVDTNGFKAEYGQAGGGVMTFASKSGTNKFQARRTTSFATTPGCSRLFRQEAIGVPSERFRRYRRWSCLDPKVYNGRNKTFFFVSFEGFRNRVGSNDTILTVPTPEMYKGDFSNWVDASDKLIPIYDPATQVAECRAAAALPAVYFQTTRFLPIDSAR